MVHAVAMGIRILGEHSVVLLLQEAGRVGYVWVCTL